MPDLDHAALEAAARAATQGEWRAGGVRGTIVGALDQNGTWLDAVADVESGPHDAAYIVAAQPSVILALLEERKRLVERARGLRFLLVRVVNEGTGGAATEEVSDQFLGYVPAECAAMKARATAAEAERDRMKELATEAHGCFVAARCEGWVEALADGDPERINDLWLRRIAFAETAVEAALAGEKEPKP